MNSLIPRVFICSQYRAALTAEERKRLPAAELIELRDQRLMENMLIALAGCAFAHAHGKLPLAPHLYFTRFLEDDDPEERAEGIRLGSDWLMECEQVWVMNETISEGMKAEIALAKSLGIPVQYFTPLDICKETDAGKYFLPIEEPIVQTTPDAARV